QCGHENVTTAAAQNQRDAQEHQRQVEQRTHKARVKREVDASARLDDLIAEAGYQLVRRKVLLPCVAKRELLERDNAGDKALVWLEPGGIGWRKKHGLAVE